MILKLRTSLSILSAISISIFSPAIGFCDELSDREAIKYEVATLLQRKDFAKLESIARDYRSSKTSSGVSKLPLFSGGIELVFNYKRKEPEFWNAAEQLAIEWIKLYPKSATAQLAYAQVLIAQAWSYRGGGYANTVKTENWPLFQEYLEKARIYLEQNKAIASTNPQWYVEMISVAKGQGWTDAKFSKLINEGLSRYPLYDNIYYQSVGYYGPKWGGNARKIEKFARESVKRTQATEGLAMYARIYWVASQNDYRENLFTDTLVDWSSMKKGIDDVLKKYPDSWNVNNFAKFACLAGDKTKTKELISRINQPPIAKAWGNVSYFQQCKDWALQ
jgi:hypothetical protein